MIDLVIGSCYLKNTEGSCKFYKLCSSNSYVPVPLLPIHMSHCWWSQWNSPTSVPLIAINDWICPKLNSGQHDSSHKEQFTPGPSRAQGKKRVSFLPTIQETHPPNGRHCQVLAAAMEQQRVQNSNTSSPYVPLERAAQSDLERRAANLELESQSPQPLVSQSHASGEGESCNNLNIVKLADWTFF